MKYEYIKEVDIHLPIAENYKDVWTFIQSDYFRMKGKTANFSATLAFLFIEPTFWFLFWLRIASYKKKNLLWMIAKFIHRRNMFKYHMLIPASTRIGFGIYIGHPLSIVINSSAIIGNNVTISQFTNIGANHTRAAYIGDNVYMAPSVLLIEAISIGSNSTIGAGSIVPKNIHSNCTVAGNPARVIKENTPARYLGTPWKFSPIEETIKHL
ncbi:serine O-acetyltransferase [Hoylesella marshii]|uniref:Bacterial transferase hexapeptide repeat protein n=1 Tax=Hoylesella marshii DSM 16973 = JCM 13450 TaxID=862515 RepID=E0NTF7_9BACT|nr:serine acetyltransferase [Hoylesella marshii]EFM01624.1 bacterial transferase hexapeptide repeat protein [Hoylesella marshii DSM 16973 = JCM 13450]